MPQTSWTPEQRTVYREVVAWLRADIGLDLDLFRQEVVLRRLARRIGAPVAEGIADYRERLRRLPLEGRRLADELQLPSARLYRDPRLFQGLTAALPKWLGESLRPQVWIPACGTGDELFALALLTATVAPEVLPRLRLVGTDADPRALAVARRGEVDEAELRHWPAVWRHWIDLAPGGGRYEARILGCSQFVQQGWLAPPPGEGYDLVYCRDLLSRMELSVQRRWLEHFHSALRPGGRLLVAADEGGLVHRDLFAEAEGPGDGPAVFSRLERRRPAVAGEALPDTGPLHGDADAMERLFDRATEPMALLDGGGILSRVNAAFAHFLGLSATTLRGSRLQDWLTPDRPPPDLARLAPTPGHPTVFEHGVLTPTGARASVRFSLERIAENCYGLILRADAELARISDELQLRRRRMDLIGGLLREAVVATDAEGRITDFSGTAERMMGWRGDEALGQPVERIVHVLDAKGGAVDLRAQGPLSPAGARTHWENAILVSRDGRRITIRLDSSPLEQPDGTQGAVFILGDTTEYVLLAEELAYRSARDPLTGLLSRDEFERCLAAALADARQHQRRHLFAYLDLDQFKVINDTLGHFAGDELLRQFGALLRTRVRSEDMVARLGGDEFGILVDQCDETLGREILENIQTAARGFRFSWDGQLYGLTVTMGVTFLDQDTPSTARVLSEADAACYAAKDAGRDRFHFAGNSDEFSRRQGEMGMVARINRALDRDLFELHYEDVVRCQAPDQVVYRELLVRMRDETAPGRLIPPGLFIAAAERYYLIGAVDRWVLNRALATIAARPAEGILYGINLSGQSVNDEQFLQYALACFEQHGVAPEQVCFEITETAAISHLKEARHFIERLSAAGCCFALDDFGAGMASFSYLKNLPVTYVKIDGSFVRSMLQNRVDRGMVDALNHIGHEMGLKTVAEHVEDEALLRTLADMGVDYAQGWAISRGRPFTAE